MWKKSLVTRIKSAWLWVVSAPVALGVGIWALIRHLVSAAVATMAGGGLVKSVVATAAVGAAAAGFTFSFGDKTGGLTEYANKTSEFIAAEDYDQAAEYVDSLLAALDEHLTTLEQEDTAVVPGSQSKSLRRGRATRALAEFLRANVQLAAGELTEKQWIAAFEQASKTTAAILGEADSRLLPLAVGNLTSDRAWALLKTDLPAGDRARLALWLMTESNPELIDWAQGYDQFQQDPLTLATSRQAGPELLARHIESLDQAGQWQLADDTLDHFVVLFADTDLGAQAASLRVGRVEPGPARAALVIDLVRQHPGSAVARALLNSYVWMLMEQDKAADVLAAIDRDNQLGQVATLEQLPAVLYRLRQQTQQSTGQLGSGRSANHSRSGAHSDAAESSAAFDLIGTRLARQLLDSGLYAASAEFSLAVLQDNDATPISLVTGQAIRRSSDIADTRDADVAEPLAEYFAALVAQAQGQSSMADQALAELAERSLPDGLRAHILSTQARRAQAVGDYNRAADLIDQAVTSMPDSLILADWQQEITNTQRATSLRSRIRRQQRDHLAAAESAESDDQAVAHYRKVAELHLGLDNPEQAIWTYSLILERYPLNPAIPAVLADCIAVFDQPGLEKQTQRRGAFVDQLLQDYPDSPEAQRYADTLPALSR